MRIDHADLRRFVAAIFRHAGCAPPEDACIADRLVESNLVGHDSHGVIRVGDYVRWLRAGMVHANQQAQVVSRGASVVVLDGRRGFGQSIGEQAMQRGIEMAQITGLACVAVRNCGHLGRIGDWPEQAAAAGLVSLHFVNTSGFGLLVAPFGGIDRRLSANPIAAGVPRRHGPPIILDMSTCAIAEGKIKVAKNRGQHVPPGSIIDSQGLPTSDPERFYADPPGAILPVGGHKGFGLSVITEILAGALTGGGCSNPAHHEFLSNGLWSMLIDPSAMGEIDAFHDEVEQFINFVKSSRKSPGVEEILLPGEIEQQTRLRRLAHGIDVEDATWRVLVETAKSVHVLDDLTP